MGMINVTFNLSASLFQLERADFCTIERSHAVWDVHVVKSALWSTLVCLYIKIKIRECIFVTTGSIKLRLACFNRWSQQNDVANMQKKQRDHHFPILRGAVRLPDSLLHIFLSHKARRVPGGRHHEPERHSGRFVAQDDVLNPGEIPPDSKHNVRLVKKDWNYDSGLLPWHKKDCFLSFTASWTAQPLSFLKFKSSKWFSLKFLVDEMVPHGVSERRPEQEHLVVVPFVLRKHGAFLSLTRFTSAVITKTFTTV